MLLRVRVLEQAECLITNHLSENGIKIPHYITIKDIQSQGLALTTNRKLSATTDTARKLCNKSQIKLLI